MIPDMQRQTDPRSPRAIAWVVAAILLVLNWTVPGAPLLKAPPFQRHAAPGISSDTRDAQLGTLPRALAQDSRSEAGTTKRYQSDNAGTSKPFALAPWIAAFAPPHVCKPAPIIGRAGTAIAVARVFDPRAPPTPMA